MHIFSALLDASVFGSNIQVPVDHTIIAVSLFEPFIRFGEVATVELDGWSATWSCIDKDKTYEALVSAERARMHTFEHIVLRAINTGTTLLCRRTPSQEDHTVRTLLTDKVYNLLCEFFPSLARMGVSLMGTNSQASI